MIMCSDMSERTAKSRNKGENMKKIGMVVAIMNELGGVFRKFGSPKETVWHGSMDVHVFERGETVLYVAHSGAGEIGAAAAVQLLASVYGVELIVNFGVVGGLTAEMKKATSAIVTRVVHYSYDTSAFDGTVPGQYIEFPDVYIPVSEDLVEKAASLYPKLPLVTIASADRFVADPEEKRALHDKFGADICDMESAGIALTAYRNRVPVLMIKTVSDGIEGGAEEFAKECVRTAEMALQTAIEVIGGLE